ncbi:MAG: type II toxin-antitoxin system Phd/YefM family antitoxin [Rhodomicrobium sp.]
MSTHSVAEAKNKLPELIDRALKGEEIVVTRHGRPVVELRPIPEPERRITRKDIEWLRKHRVGDHPAPMDAGTLVSTMRDEEYDR